MECAVIGCKNEAAKKVTFTLNGSGRVDDDMSNSMGTTMMICQEHYDKVQGQPLQASMGCVAATQEATPLQRIEDVDGGRFKKLINAVTLSKTCMNCSTFNPNAKDSYRCAAPPSCPGVTIDKRVISYIMWKIGEITDKQHMDYCLKLDEHITNRQLLIDVLVKQLRLVGKELDDVVGIALVHGGYHCGADVLAEGQSNRDEIKKLCVKIYGKDMGWVQ